METTTSTSNTSTSRTNRNEARRVRNNPNKRVRRKFGTPKFPVHPEGYNASAADAKKA